MNSPTDDEPDHESVIDLFFAERIALVKARAEVAWHEYQLKELAKAHPAVAGKLPPLSDYTLADLRSDELNDSLDRINAALQLTGEEQDYWLRLWDYARGNLGVAEDEFDSMTREKLAAIVGAGLPGVPCASTPDESAADPLRNRTPEAAVLNARRSRFHRNRP